MDSWGGGDCWQREEEIEISSKAVRTKEFQRAKKVQGNTIFNLECSSRRHVFTLSKTTMSGSMKSLDLYFIRHKNNLDKQI